MGQVFLTAEWRHLVMVNYAVDPAVVQSRVPAGTELDCFEGQAYISMVGFMFLNTRVMGVPIPLHQNFEEVNLRFYVRRGDRRGVVFVREIVPRHAIATVARVLYNEQYVAYPMRHQVDSTRVQYEWGKGQKLGGRPVGEPREQLPDTLESFITEHYWGYTRQRDGSCMEYQVEHPSWKVWNLADVVFEADVERLYGTEFVQPLARPPASAFLADGSPVSVYRGTHL